MSAALGRAWANPPMPVAKTAADYRQRAAELRARAEGHSQPTALLRALAQQAEDRAVDLEIQAGA